MIRRLLLLSGLAAIGAVSHHAVNWGLNAMFWWTDRYMVTSVPNYDLQGGLSYNTLRIIDQFSFFPVPAFLFVSGYFVAAAAGRADRPIEWKLLGNRVRMLLPPYVLWSVVAMVMNVFNGQQYSPSRVAWELLMGGAAAPFYYIPLLVQLYFLSRWMADLARRHWLVLLVLTGSVQLMVPLSRTCVIIGASICESDSAILNALVNWQLLAYPFWFAFGLVAAFHQAGFKAFLRRLKPALPLLLVLLHVVAFFEWQQLVRVSGRPWIAGGVSLGDTLVSLVMLLTFFAYEELPLPFPSALSLIGGRSYGIYLIHIPVLEVTARAIYQAVPALLAYPVVLQFLLIAAGVGFPVLLMHLVQKSPLRRFYVYAFG